MLFGGGAGKITLPSWQEIFTIIRNVADALELEEHTIFNPVTQWSLNTLEQLPFYASEVYKAEGIVVHPD